MAYPTPGAAPLPDSGAPLESNEPAPDAEGGSDSEVDPSFADGVMAIMPDATDDQIAAFQRGVLALLGR